MNVARAAIGLGLLGVVAVGLAVGTSADAAKKVKTMDIADIKPGMRGHAVTVFKGRNTDKFEVEIVDTIPNYLPKQDAVLFKSTDPRLVHSGIVGGMSGSPIFIDGKLCGALAYGWRFNKDALGGMTPISNMKQVGALPYRPDVLPHPRGRKRAGAAGWADAMLGLKSSALPERRRPQDLDPSDGLIPISIPLSISGLGPGSARMLADSFGMVPVRGGSRGNSKAKPPSKTWDFGDAVSVVLIEGDSSVAGNGTVTYVNPKGDRLLAFGHSMFEDGPTNLPMADSRVHTIINSVERSVKISSPQTIRGLMYQDRQAAIALRTDLRAPMVPVKTKIQGPDPDLPARTYDNRIAFGADISGNLLAVILAEAIDEAGRDATEVVIDIEHNISLETTKGPRDIKIREEVFFPSGLVGRVMARSRGIIIVAAALNNDYEVARLTEVSHKISMKYDTPIETVETLRVAEDEIRAGDLVRVEVVMRGYKGQERTEVLPLRIPDDAAGEAIQIQVAGGDYVRPYRPLPANLDDLLTTLESSYASRSLVASIYREGEGLSTRHGLLHSLPDSVLETLQDRGATRDSVRLKQLARRVIPTKKIIEGTHTIKVDVLPKKTF